MKQNEIDLELFLILLSTIICTLLKCKRFVVSSYLKTLGYCLVIDGFSIKLILIKKLVLIKIELIKYSDV